jgi:hypothetical protein
MVQYIIVIGVNILINRTINISSWTSVGGAMVAEESIAEALVGANYPASVFVGKNGTICSGNHHWPRWTKANTTTLGESSAGNIIITSANKINREELPRINIVSIPKSP